MSQRWRKYSPEFRARALELLKSCSSVSGLARELGIRRKWLYKWRNQARAKPARAGGDAKSPVPVEAVREPENGALRQRVAGLEQQLVGRQTAEIDFFRGPRRNSWVSWQDNGTDCAPTGAAWRPVPIWRRASRAPCVRGPRAVTPIRPYGVTWNPANENDTNWLTRTAFPPESESVVS